ncbi:MAG TPA: peptide chain release factor N(5)-glutamine methyltransferase [Bacteroidia bacterium]|jgi:release factor glutamine methyltransferase
MKIASNKIKDIIRFFQEELSAEYERDELETIIAYCFEMFLCIDRATLTLNGNTTVTESELLKFNFAVKDLKRHKPLQYILGEADFYRLKFKVNEHVLIPRPETEELVDLIIHENKEREKIFILDVGTGSGCIPISLKKNLSSAIVSAIDISEKALEVARENAMLNNVQIDWIQNDILADTFEPNALFDIIVSNPPYICLSEKHSMHKNVLEYEPHLALFVDHEDPLLFYKVIADLALKYLNKNGRIYFEINQALGPESQHMLESKGFKNVALIRDLSNNYRILRGNI